MGNVSHETMADATRRLQQDESDGAFEATPVPGTEEGASSPESSRDVKPDGGPPDAIPYARFKEVNDQLRELKPYQDLARAGYDHDSMVRLIQFEEAYREDPTGTISSVVEAMDLPDATKSAVKGLLDGVQEQSFVTDEGNEPEEPPEWAKPIIEDHASRMKADEDAYYDRLLDAGISHWRKLDEKDQIETPERIILRQIRASVDEGNFSTVEELAEHARSELMGYREATLGSAYSSRRVGPTSVPGSGVASSPPVKFDSIKEATKAAQAAMERGELPPIVPPGS